MADPTRPRPRVLIVDADPTLREAARVVLEAQGLEVLEPGALPEASPTITADDLLRAFEQLEALTVPTRVELLGPPVLVGDAYHVPARLTLELPPAIRLADLLALKPPPALERALEQLEQLAPEELDDPAPAPARDFEGLGLPDVAPGSCAECLEPEGHKMSCSSAPARVSLTAEPVRECVPCAFPTRETCAGCSMSTAAFLERVSAPSLFLQMLGVPAPDGAAKQVHAREQEHERIEAEHEQGRGRTS